MKHLGSLVAIAIVAVATGATAIAHADDEAARREARALIREGNSLLARDPAGALSLFQAAYAKFPSEKILVNIGSAEKELGHLAAAANAYARYLASGDVDQARVQEVTALLTALDGDLGRVTVTVAPAAPGATELQLGDGGWAPLDALAEWRAAPGPLTVRVRRAGFVDGTADTTIAPGAVAALAITLAPVPPSPTSDLIAPTSFAEREAPPAASPAGRFGIAGKVVIDGKGRGAAGVIGARLGVAGPIALELGAIVGPTYGAYGGLRASFTRRALRPLIAAGVPVFFDDGTRVGARAAGGVEWLVHPHLRMSLEVGAEYLFRRAGDIDRWVFAPAVGAEARL